MSNFRLGHHPAGTREVTSSRKDERLGLLGKVEVFFKNGRKLYPEQPKARPRGEFG